MLFIDQIFEIIIHSFFPYSLLPKKNHDTASENCHVWNRSLETRWVVGGVVLTHCPTSTFLEYKKPVWTLRAIKVPLQTRMSWGRGEEKPKCIFCDFRFWQNLRFPAFFCVAFPGDCFIFLVNKNAYFHTKWKISLGEPKIFPDFSIFFNFFVFICVFLYFFVLRFFFWVSMLSPPPFLGVNYCFCTEV